MYIRGLVNGWLDKWHEGSRQRGDERITNGQERGETNIFKRERYKGDRCVQLFHLNEEREKKRRKKERQREVGERGGGRRRKRAKSKGEKVEIVEARVPVGGMANQSPTREKGRTRARVGEEMEVVARKGVGGGGWPTAVWRHATHRGRWQQDVCEVSLLPRRWQERGKPGVTYAASSGRCAAA